MSESKDVDKDKVLAAVKQDGYALKHADPELKTVSYTHLTLPTTWLV